MAINDKLSTPGLIPIKVENQGSLITTQVNKINFTGSGVTASIGEFNDLTILITGGGGSNISASYALSASFASTASYFSGSISNAISASYALTASQANKAELIEILTAADNTDYRLIFAITSGFQNSYLDTETTALTYNPFTNTLAGIDQLNATKINATSVTSSLYGTASWAISSSQAITASYVLNAVSSSYALSSSLSANSLLLNNTASSVFATTGSNIFKGDQIISGSFKSTGSFEVLSDTPSITGTSNITLASTTIIAPALPFSIPPGGAVLNTVLIDTLNGTLYVTSSLPGSGGSGGGLADRILTGSITASVADGLNPSNPNFFLLQSGSNEMLKFNTDRVMVLETRIDTPTAVTGGIFFSASGDFFFGM